MMYCYGCQQLVDPTYERTVGMSFWRCPLCKWTLDSTVNDDPGDEYDDVDDGTVVEAADE